MGEKTHLGSFIRECRNGLKYTSRQMARLSNRRTDIPSISNSYLISVENGKHIPRLDKIIALADLLNVPITHLVDRCREDLGAQVQLPDGSELEQLLESAHEHQKLNNHVKALELFRLVYQAARSAGGEGLLDDGRITEMRLQIANCYRSLKINRVAKEEIEGLLREPSIDERTRARAAFVLAEIYRDEGNAFLGETVAKEALRLSQQCEDEALEARLTSTLGSLAADGGRIDEALKLYREAAVKLKGLGDDRSALLLRTRQGLLMVEKREYFKAIDLLKTELASCNRADPYVFGFLHIGLAKAYFGAENYKSTRSHARAARESGEKLDDPMLLFSSCFYLWMVARRERTLDVAQMHLERLKYYRNKLETPLVEVEQFDRMQRQAREREAERRGATA